MMRRLVIVAVALLSFASFPLAALAQDSTATSPPSETVKKPARHHRKSTRKHRRTTAAKHRAAKKDSTSTTP